MSDRQRPIRRLGLSVAPLGRFHTSVGRFIDPDDLIRFGDIKKHTHQTGGLRSPAGDRCAPLRYCSRQAILRGEGGLVAVGEVTISI